MDAYAESEKFLEPSPPKMIYLQWTGDDFDSTWCIDLIDDDDEPYYRHCVVSDLQESADELIGAVNAALMCSAEWWVTCQEALDNYFKRMEI